MTTRVQARWRGPGRRASLGLAVALAGAVGAAAQGGRGGGGVEFAAGSRSGAAQGAPRGAGVGPAAVAALAAGQREGGGADVSGWIPRPATLLLVEGARAEGDRVVALAGRVGWRVSLGRAACRQVGGRLLGLALARRLTAPQRGRLAAGAGQLGLVLGRRSGLLRVQGDLEGDGLGESLRAAGLTGARRGRVAFLTWGPPVEALRWAPRGAGLVRVTRPRGGVAWDLERRGAACRGLLAGRAPFDLAAEDVPVQGARLRWYPATPAGPGRVLLDLALAPDVDDDVARLLLTSAWDPGPGLAAGGGPARAFRARRRAGGLRFRWLVGERSASRWLERWLDRLETELGGERGGEQSREPGSQAGSRRWASAGPAGRRGPGERGSR